MNPKLKELQSHWYQILKDEGFEDIEDISSPQENLKTWSGRFSMDFTYEEMRERSEYTHLAEKFLEDYVFDSKRDRDIWTEHCEGYSARNIAIILSESGTKVSKSCVAYVVARLQKIMLESYI